MKRYATPFLIALMSRVLGVSRGGYYKWLNISQSKQRSLNLDEEIKAIFEQSKRRYGSPRVCSELNKRRAQTKVSVTTVARRMQALK